MSIDTHLGFLLRSAVIRLRASSDSLLHTAGFTFRSAYTNSVVIKNSVYGK